MATRTIANGGGNWSATTTWVEGAVPTASDDVVATGTSGNLTINATAACRSIDLTNYTGTVTHSTAVTLTIGTSTANPSGVALKFVAGMTYTITDQTSTITFASTATTQQTVTTAGQAFGGTTIFNGSGASWLLSDNFNGHKIELDQGTLNDGGHTVTLGGNGLAAGVTSTSTLTLSGTWNLNGAGFVWDCSFSGASVSASGVTINITDTSASSKTFKPHGGETYGAIVITAGGTGAINLGNNVSYTITQLTCQGGAKTLSMVNHVGTLTVTTWQVSGTAGNPVKISSDSAGTAWTLSVASGVVFSDYVTLKDSKGTGGATFLAGPNSSNISGNTGWTFLGVAVDATANGTNGPTTATNSLTYSHTVGSRLVNGAIYIGVAIHNSTSQVGGAVTYAGQSCTQIGALSQSTNARIELWRLLNPPAGANNVVITLAAAATAIIYAGSVSYSGVNQAVPEGTVATNSNTATATDTVTTTGSTGNQVVAALSAQQNTNSNLSMAASGALVQRVNVIAASNGANTNGIFMGDQPSGASITSTVTITNSQTGRGWAMIGVEVRAALPPKTTVVDQAVQRAAVM